MTTPDGRTITLPPGVTEERVRAIFAKFRSGGEADVGRSRRDGADARP